MSVRTTEPGGHEPRAVQRALALLEAVATLGAGASARDVAALTRIPPATAYRLLNLLVADGYLVRVEDLSGFALGLRTRELAGAALAPVPVLDPGPVLEELRSLAQAWTAGMRPTQAQLQQWSPLAVLVFLQHLPRDLDHASLAWLDAQLHLTGRGNYEIVVEWLTIAAGSDYEPVFGRIREVLTQVGRMKFLRPLFVALGKHERTRQLGREIYDTAKATYHSLSRRVIEAVMAQWATP